MRVIWPGDPLFTIWAVLTTQNKNVKNETINKINRTLQRYHLFKIKVITRVVLQFGETVRVKDKKINYNMTLARIIAEGQNLGQMQKFYDLSSCYEII